VKIDNIVCAHTENLSKGSIREVVVMAIDHRNVQAVKTRDLKTQREHDQLPSAAKGPSAFEERLKSAAAPTAAAKATDHAASSSRGNHFGWWLRDLIARARGEGVRGNELADRIAQEKERARKGAIESMTGPSSMDW
jgi:hypothetical protein